MVNIGTYKADNSGRSCARAISPDGVIIAGEAEAETGNSQAFKYTDAAGMIDLGTLATNNAGKPYANAVSGDSSVIIGTASNNAGTDRPFIYATQMQDLLNVQVSKQQIAVDLASLVQQSGTQTKALRAQYTPVAAGKTYSLGVQGLASLQGPDAQSGNGYALLASGALRLSDNLQFGGNASVQRIDTVKQASKFGVGGGTGVFAQYSFAEGRMNGLSLRADAAFTRATYTLIRGNGLDNVQQDQGDADVSSISAGVQARYDYQLGSDLTVSPFAGGYFIRSERGSYVESAALDAPAAFAGVTQKEFVAEFGLSSAFAVTSKLSVSGTVSAEADLYADASEILYSGGSSANVTAAFAKRNAFRPSAGAELTYQFKAGPVVRVGGTVSRATYGQNLAGILSAKLSMLF
ncbi:autotransporter domain-containing protein [Pseudovibrio sp. Tun.PSC04-5.I4]|uniref:autotransporter domain-containing protein n=1 Tax=Pseudovibrio sp. Tun.PSC04-5.I4 TaxID=1798213 RepID=UPI0008883FB6|nr:autotransporter domain-containing protein [Pseudovibrio sp. Tun.PSC04-5.I4]SDQ16681.1 probable extracellular repeat, HAF family [Pseudovibrio sp. Tun.PSC04-5.I4]